jgi:hypothetical protein
MYLRRVTWPSLTRVALSFFSLNPVLSFPQPSKDLHWKSFPSEPPHLPVFLASLFAAVVILVTEDIPVMLASLPPCHPPPHVHAHEYVRRYVILKSAVFLTEADGTCSSRFKRI